MKRCATLELVILSSLIVGPGVKCQPLSHGVCGVNAHLLAAVDQTLLCRWDTLLLLDALLYPRDLLLVSYTVFPWLSHFSHRSNVQCTSRAGWRRQRWKVAYLVVGFDVELDLLAGESSYSGRVSAYLHMVPEAAVEPRLV